VKRWLSRWWLKILLAGLAGFLLIQLVPYRVDNPSRRDQPKWDSQQTHDLALRSCGACHSNETHVLSFERIAPVSWYVTNHVKDGRATWNFDEWSTNPGSKADDAWKPLAEGSMPPDYYHYFGLHQDTKLSAKETQELIDGLKKTIAADPPAGRGH
jgi:hypothetical protein